MSASLYPNTKMVIEYIVRKQDIQFADATERFYRSGVLKQMQANPEYYKTWSPLDLYQKMLDDGDL
jgi:hypothetical protein